MSDDDGGSGIIGKLIKWAIILWLSGMTGGLFLFVYLGWKYVKICILFYFKALYLIIRLPIWLFIQLPLHYLGVGVHKTTESIEKAYGVMVAKKKRYGLLFGLMFLFMIYSFLPRNTDAAMSFLTQGTLILPFLVLIPFTITFLVAFISARSSMPDVARREMPSGLNTGMKDRTKAAGAAAGTAAGAAAQAGQMGMKAYNNKKEIKEAGRTAAKAAAKGGPIAKDMMSVMRSMPVISTMMSGGSAAAGSAASAAGSVTAASGGTALAVFLVALLLAVLGFIVISAVITFFLWGMITWLTTVMAPLLSPVLGAIGLGQAYGSFFGSEVANNFLPQVDLEAERRMVQEAGAKVSCALQGPACLRQWRANNTARPGSEDVGEKYRLEVDEFSLGGQSGVDIAYKRPEYKVPVSFLMVNTRHGLKGIDARNVEWRVRIGDADRSGKKAYCGTGWKSVDNLEGSDGTILPGTSFSPRLSNLDELSLGECDMLQPALGHDYTGELDVKYDYSSQSTLYVRAMSRQNMRDEEITPEFKESETADTPVQTFINVKEPITYVSSENTGDNSGARSIPFTVQVGTNTDRYDIEYRVHPDNFDIVDSSVTTNSGDSCIGLNSTGEPNQYELSELAQNRINNRIDTEDTTTWFDRAKNPSPARCTFEIENPGSVSPTGETLTMRVDANYTVVIEETSDPFEVKNTMCTQGLNCPVLFQLNSDELETLKDAGLPPTQWTDSVNEPELTSQYRNYDKAFCKGADAGNGCTAVPEYQYQDQYSDDNSTAIEDDSLAVEWNKDVAKVGKLFSCSVKDRDFERNAAGIPKDELEQVVGSDAEFLEFNDEGELEAKDYSQEFSEQVFPDSIDWLLNADHDVTKDPVGCENGKPVYKVDCNYYDKGISNWAEDEGIALQGGACTN